MVIGSIEYVDYEKTDGSRMDMTRIVPGMPFNTIVILLRSNSQL